MNENFFNEITYSISFIVLKLKNFNNVCKKLILYSLRNVFYPKIYHYQGDEYLKIKDFYSILENYFNCMSDYRESIYNDSMFENIILNLISYGCLPEIDFDPEEPDSKDISIVMNDLFDSYI